jgi:hypothetical protein
VIILTAFLLDAALAVAQQKSRLKTSAQLLCVHHSSSKTLSGSSCTGLYTAVPQGFFPRLLGARDVVQSSYLAREQQPQTKPHFQTDIHRKKPAKIWNSGDKSSDNKAPK